MGLNRNINDDNTLAYLFNKTRQGASDAIEKAIESLKSLFVKKTGDTMSGSLVVSNTGPAIYLKNTDVDYTDETRDENASSTYYHRDKNNKNLSYWQTTMNTAGRVQTTLAARRSVNGEEVTNSLSLRVAANGTPSVSTSSPEAWRSALGLGSIATVDSPVPIANGGTGLTASPSMLTNLGSTTADTILEASPRPGITGTLAIAHGGTGATTAADARTNLGAVNKAGDTMTGDLVIEPSSTPHIHLDNNLADTSAATPPADYYWDLWFRDKNNKGITYIESTLNTSGRAQTALATRRIVNGSNVDNAVYLRVAADGTREVVVTSAEIWRAALGLGTSGAFPITIAQGGTGATSASSAVDGLHASYRYGINGSSNISSSVKRKLSFSGAVYGLLYVSGSSSARCGVYVLYGSTTTVVVEPIKAATACTIATGSGYFTITSSSGSFNASILTTGSNASRITETAAT